MDVTVHLQPARPEDAASIASVWHDGWRDGHLGHVPVALEAHRGRAEFDRRALDRIPLTTVAQRGGEVVGFIVVRDDEVEQLYVAEAARGSGVAADLLVLAEERIGRCHRTAWLAVVEGNRRARRFYERNGWHDAGPFANPAEITGGAVLEVPSRRYEKALHVGASA